MLDERLHIERASSTENGGERMKAEQYYREIEAKWRAEYPAPTDIEDVWAFYRECGYADPQATIRGLLDRVEWSNHRVLDLGCDRGLMLGFICDELPGVEGHGIDINGQAIATAKELFPQHRFDVFDGVTIPYPDKHFDLAFVCAVVKHVRYEDRERFYAELNRVATLALLIEVDSREQEEVAMQGWTFYHSNFEKEFARHLVPIDVVHEAGDLLGIYACS